MSNEWTEKLTESQTTADIALHLWKEYTLAGMEAHARAAWQEHEDANEAVNWAISKLLDVHF